MPVVHHELEDGFIHELEDDAFHELESSSDDGTDFPLMNHDTIVGRAISVLSYIFNLIKGD